MSAGEGVKRFWARVVAEDWRRDGRDGFAFSFWGLIVFWLAEEGEAAVVAVLEEVLLVDDGGGCGG